MAKYQVGDKVINVNSREKGVIIDVFNSGRGRQLYRVRYGVEDKDSLESNLIQDTDLTDPFECCKQGLFGSYLDFSRINTTFKIHNTSNNTISSLKASKTIFKAYQFKPLLKFLNSANRRLLIADEVGLGKTIEAGHIMMELAARKELRNVLIICPKMLQEKWKNELKEKFNFAFKIYDRKSDLVNDLSTGIVKGIVNYEMIRSSEKNKIESNSLLALISEQNIKFDLILCDEAHKLRNRGTQTFKGAQIIMPFSTSIVFLTATPIMISEENLFNLLSLLDNQQFNNKEIFQTYLSINKPFIKAISQLNNKIDFLQIAEELRNSKLLIHYGDENSSDNNTTVGVLFADIPLYKKIIEDLESKPDNINNRVQLQFDVSSMSMMNNIFSRTRKREVITDWTQPVREPQTIKVNLYDDERYQFDNVISEYVDDHGYIDEYGDAKLSQGHALGLIQKKRRIASSVYAYLNTENDLNNDVDEYASFRDAKFDELLKIIDEVVKHQKKKLIVFALFKNTLKYLSIRLKKNGHNPAVIHGDISERDLVINKFKSDITVNILLSSEVGSEGLDLQFCDALVNYDLPWNPMVVEQRIGRIDRFGQKSQIVNMYNLVVKDSIQEEIFDRLLNRIGIFRSCIGDLEAIFDYETESGTLQQRIMKLEKELYCTELSQNERAQKIENISRAILIEKQNLEQISEGLTDSLTNDTYFKNEIEKVQKNYRYITEQELYNYVQSLIRNQLKECSLVEINEGIYKFCFPLSEKKYFINFLLKYQPNSDTESELQFRQFLNSIRDVFEFELTFNQDIAYNNQELIYVNAYHPIILATKECFKQSFKSINTAFQFGIVKERFKDLAQIESGEYFLAIYTIYLTKKWFGKVQENEMLIPIVYNIQTKSIISDKDVSERVLGESHLFATVNQIPFKPSIQLVDTVRVEMAIEIEELYNEYLQDQRMRLETSKGMQIQRTEEFYNNRINNLEISIADLEFKALYSLFDEERVRVQRVLPAQRGLLKSLKAEKEEAVQKISDSEIQSKAPKLLSLSQIKIYS
jgi:SNF2 family DNA or RNA helicase